MVLAGLWGAPGGDEACSVDACETFGFDGLDRFDDGFGRLEKAQVV